MVIVGTYGSYVRSVARPTNKLLTVDCRLLTSFAKLLKLFQINNSMLFEVIICWIFAISESRRSFTHYAEQSENHDQRE